MAVSINNLSFPSCPCPQSKIRARVKSSTYAKSAKSDIWLRPKTAIRLNPGGLESFYLTKRSETSPGVEMNSLFTCDRSLTSLLEPTKAYRFPSAPGKRSPQATSAANKVVDDASQLYDLGPGYSIHRNESQFAVRIDSDEFFGTGRRKERQETTRKHFQDHKDILIIQLQEQIRNLTVFLEEQKINHNLSVMQYEEKLEATRYVLVEKYTLEIEELKKAHKQILQNSEEDHEMKLEIQKEELDAKLNRVHEELITCKASFESFRYSLMKEANEKLESEKAQLTEEFDLQLEEKLQKQQNELKFHYELAMDNATRKHSEEVNGINAKYKSEIEALNRRFAGSISIEEQLTQTLQELKKKKREHQKLQAEYDGLHQAYSKSQRELAIALNDNENLKDKVQEFSNNFEERVRGVDDDYKMKIDSLQNKIVEMRRAYMSKCEELVEERNQSDMLLHNRVENARDVMIELIHTRQRAQISLISMDSDPDVDEAPTNRRGTGTSGSGDHHPQLLSKPVPRPVSAPLTDQDERMAKQQSFLINKNYL